MTARVCPVHGEYAPTGICRWCEPQSLLDVALSGPKVRPLPVAEAAPWAANRTSREWGVDAVPSPTGYETTFTLTEKVADAYVWRLEWTEPVIDFDANAIHESLLAERHAALRWERVARRWNYKHRNPKGLNEQERAYVWRCWLSQQQRIFDDSDWLRRQQERFIAAGIPKEWP